MIEEAYQKKLPEALIDDYHLDFKKSLQISNSNPNNQRPVKRISRDGMTIEPRLREARFMPNPIHSATPFAEHRFFLGLIGEVFKQFNVHDSQALETPANRRLLIEKAAEGIIIAGKLIGKEKEAEWTAQQLRNVIDESDQQLWQCCAHLCTMESFLYKKMNEYMRLCGNQSKLNLWKSKMVTFGPFAYLLQALTFKNKGTNEYSKFYFYRGANLSDDLIQQYRDNIGAYLTFPAFTSTSRNRKKAEQFGNVLFIIRADSLKRNSM
ncbi:unnamed protein product [Rotaria sp. Silwood1]|nr:unnamed protein product [Rotaria sp. Silwood1]